MTYAAELADDLALALAMADAADVATLDRYQSLDLVVETKPDLTPVSDADRATEQLLRDHLAKARPHDPVLGEEMGADTSITSGRRWIIDPIDGTKNYVRGVPVWATLIALVDGADIVVGVVSAPALGRRWWAAKGAGAWAGGLLVGAPKQIHASEVGRSPTPRCRTPTPSAGRTGGAAFRDLAGRCWRTRAYGDFWSHMLVAEGAVDVAVEPELSIWDVAALVPVVREAGGRVTSTSGGSVLDGGGAVSSNGRLHDEVLRPPAAAATEPPAAPGAPVP